MDLLILRLMEGAIEGVPTTLLPPLLVGSGGLEAESFADGDGSTGSGEEDEPEGGLAVDETARTESEVRRSDRVSLRLITGNPVRRPLLGQAR